MESPVLNDRLNLLAGEVGKGGSEGTAEPLVLCGYTNGIQYILALPLYSCLF